MNRIPFFIDFDRVLFDTDTLRQALCDTIEAAGFSEATAMDAYKKATCTHLYLPENHIVEAQELQPEVSVQTATLSDMLYSCVDNLLYPDTLSFLRNINREAYTVNLLTLGAPVFQQTKIDHTGIADFFDAIHICTVEKADHLPSLISLDAPFVLIDDRIDSIQAIQAKYPHSFTLFKDYKDEHSDFTLEHSARVTTLTELKEITLPSPFPPLLVAE
jgi:hypothetical protein